MGRAGRLVLSNARCSAVWLPVDVASASGCRCGPSLHPPSAGRDRGGRAATAGWGGTTPRRRRAGHHSAPDPTCVPLAHPARGPGRPAPSAVPHAVRHKPPPGAPGAGRLAAGGARAGAAVSIFIATVVTRAFFWRSVRRPPAPPSRLGRRAAGASPKPAPSSKPGLGEARLSRRRSGEPAVLLRAARSGHHGVVGAESLGSRRRRPVVLHRGRPGGTGTGRPASRQSPSG